MILVWWSIQVLRIPWRNQTNKYTITLKFEQDVIFWSIIQEWSNFLQVSWKHLFEKFRKPHTLMWYMILLTVIYCCLVFIYSCIIDTDIFQFPCVVVMKLRSLVTHITQVSKPSPSFLTCDSTTDLQQIYFRSVTGCQMNPVLLNPCFY